MNKDRIKKLLAGVGVATLISGVALSSGCGQQKSETEDVEKTKTEMEAKASCGAGDTTADTTGDTTASGSCGQGSCGQ